MQIRLPAPLQGGCRVAVTAPSSGVAPAVHTRLDLCLAHLRTPGFVIEAGQCLRSERLGASTPANKRAAGLMHHLLRDDNAAFALPWGGEITQTLA